MVVPDGEAGWAGALSPCRTRSLEGIFDGESLPDVAGMYHKIAFGRRRKQERLLVHYGLRIYAGRHKAMRVTTNELSARLQLLFCIQRQLDHTFE